MRSFVIGFIVALLVGAGAVYFYFTTGTAPVAVEAQAMPFEKTLARKALNARVEKEMPKPNQTHIAERNGRVSKV